MDVPAEAECQEELKKLCASESNRRGPDSQESSQQTAELRTRSLGPSANQRAQEAAQSVSAVDRAPSEASESWHELNLQWLQRFGRAS